MLNDNNVGKVYVDYRIKTSYSIIGLYTATNFITLSALPWVLPGAILKALAVFGFGFIFNGKVMDEVRWSFEGILVVGHLIFFKELIAYYGMPREPINLTDFCSFLGASYPLFLRHALRSERITLTYFGNKRSNLGSQQSVKLLY